MQNIGLNDHTRKKLHIDVLLFDFFLIFIIVHLHNFKQK
jgi:hypothetical protein